MANIINTPPQEKSDSCPNGEGKWLWLGADEWHDDGGLVCFSPRFIFLDSEYTDKREPASPAREKHEKSPEVEGND